MAWCSMCMYLLRDAGDEAAVGEHDALGESGGAGGVRQRDDVVGVDVGVGVELLGRDHLGELHAAVEAAVDGDDGDAPPRRELAHLLHGAGLGDDDLGARRLRLAVDLVRGVERVGRGGGGAQPRRAEEGEGELGAVAEQVHHHVALAHAHGAEPRRGATGQRLHLRVRVRRPRLPVDEAGAVRHLAHLPEAVGLQRLAVVDLDVGKLGTEHHRRLLLCLRLRHWHRHRDRRVHGTHLDLASSREGKTLRWAVSWMVLLEFGRKETMAGASVRPRRGSALISWRAEDRQVPGYIRAEEDGELGELVSGALEGVTCGAQVEVGE